MEMKIVFMIMSRDREHALKHTQLHPRHTNKCMYTVQYLVESD